MGSVAIGEVVAAAAVVALGTFAVSALVRLAVGRGRRPVVAPALLDAALLASLAAVLIATLSPLEQLGTGLDHPAEVNLQPFEAMRGAPPIFALINALLLIPYVLLLALRWRRAGVIRLTLAGATLSIAIELLQLVHPERGTNVDDVLLNTGGAAVAAVVGVLLRRAVSPRQRTAPPSRRSATTRPRVGAR